MRGVVSETIPVCYVKRMADCREFYALLGYAEVRSGGERDAQWSYLRCGESFLLLAAVQPPIIPAELPLLIYLYVDDLSAVRERFTAAGRPYEHVGYPDHAPGGEARTHDPDGNVVLLGQRTAVPEADRVAQTGESARFSLIRQAAEAIGRRGGAPATCQIGAADGTSCGRDAEVKLADPWGDTAWGCVPHAEEALINARSAFVASEDGHGLGPFLRIRHGRVRS